MNAQKKTFVLLGLTCLFITQTAHAQERKLEPRWMPTKPVEVKILQGQDPTRLIFKLQDDSEAQVLGERLYASSQGPDLSQVTAILARLGDASIEPLIPLPKQELQRMRRAGETKSGERLADMSQYFLLRLGPEWRRQDAVMILNLLSSLDAVEEAYAAPLSAPAPGGTPTGDYVPSQGYRTTSLGGIDADYAETVTGGDGSGITVADVEYSWNIQGIPGATTNGHEDLTGVAGQSAIAIGNTSNWTDPFNDTDHGTAVAGILKGDANTFGTKGIVPGADFRVIAAETTNGRRVAAAISIAARALQPGDVILIEQQEFGPNYDFTANPPTQWGLVASEIFSDVFNAIRLATSLGIHVVEAAGNGSQDYDDYTDGAPGTGVGDPVYVLFNPLVRNSGAHLVSAGVSWPTTSAPPSWANLGIRVNAFAWGDSIVTHGYGDLFDGGGVTPDPDRLYTQTFGGTSGASAIVAGAVASLSGVHKAKHQEPMQPSAVGLLLRTWGTYGAIGWLGRQPELESQITVVEQGIDPSLVVSQNIDSSAQMGNTILNLGDIDGDTFDDMLVGSYREDTVVPLVLDRGAVSAISGRNGSTIYKIKGTVWNEWLGFSTGIVGDINGDNITDYVCGHLNAGPSSQGFARIYSGANGATLFTMNGTSAFPLGWTVAGLGDVSGDSVPDMLLGSPTVNSFAGEVRVQSTSGAFIRSFTPPVGAGSAWFGESIASAGDVDKDGVNDVIIGGMRASTNGADSGGAWVYSGSSGNLLYSYLGDAAGDRLGDTVSGAGDLNDDGFADFMIAATKDDDGGADSGRVRVYSGQDGSLLYTFDGAASGDQFGSSLAGIGNFNGDKYDDFAIGAQNEDANGGTDTGSVRVYSGKSGQLLRTYTGHPGTYGGLWVGTAIGTGMDLNRDGRPDVAVGETLYDGGRGRVVVYLAPAAKAPKTTSQRVSGTPQGQTLTPNGSKGTRTRIP